VMINLLENAASFAPIDSVIMVKLSRNKSSITITVEDEGPGIPEHALERVFERFYTDRPPEQGFGQNSGLGLSISRQIIEAHRGTITVANRPARDSEQELAGNGHGGACFTVILPAAHIAA
jgi:two-component system, OmpR family, sensor histidine kinase ChvG